MNKDIYLTELNNALKQLPEEEKRNAIQYYMEYFDDAGEENCQSVINELGPAKAVADQILSDYAVKALNTPAPNLSKKHFDKIKWVIIALVASPIAIPLALCVLVFVFGVCVFTLFCVLGILFSCVAGVGFGIVGIVFGIYLCALGDIFTGIFASGCSFVLIGLGILCGLLSVSLGKLIVTGCKKLVILVAERRKKHEKA